MNSRRKPDDFDRNIGFQPTPRATLELNENSFFSAVVLHAFDVDQVYHSHLPTQIPEADFELRDLIHIVSAYFDSLEFSLEFVHHTMLEIQKDFTRLVKRYVEEQRPIVFQNISDWLLRMFRQHQKIKRQRERENQTPEKKQQLNQQRRQRRAELTPEEKMRIHQNDSQRRRRRQQRAALSPEKKSRSQSRTE